MKRRFFLSASTASSALLLERWWSCRRLEGAETPSNMVTSATIQPLANSFVTLWKSPPQSHLVAGTPGMVILPGGRLVATFQINGKDASIASDAWGDWRGRVLISDDAGQNWRETTSFPMTGARPIVAGKRLYVVGHNAGVCLIASSDGGNTWSQPSRIRSDEVWRWYSQACSVVEANGRVYFAMDYVRTEDGPPSRGVYAPVVMSAPTDRDWLEADAWTFSNVFTYDDALQRNQIAHVPGIPFYPPNEHLDERRLGRIIQKPGWFESNMVQIHDPDHIWHDPQGRTFHIFMRGNNGGLVNLATLAKAIHHPNGTIEVMLERAPSNAPMLHVPLPGGNNRFHITYDPVSKLYWLVSLQTTDSMKKIKLLNPKRWNLPDNERHRLVLHFSKNCIDWCFAGLIAKAEDDGQSRHYGPGVIDGNQMHVLCRSASAAAKNAHEADMLTFHSIKDFRRLIY